MKRVDVVAGIIFNSQRTHVLLALRKPDQHQGNRWEFPGGKIEPDETQEEALKRELLEEINLSVESCTHRQTLEHHYTDKHVRLHFRDVTAFTGTPRGCEGQQLDWVALEDLADLSFPEANQPIVDALVNLSGAATRRL
ncbi:MAG: 8-oxo-dGTP diphosphatase MutT [Granulosicoccus sp.]